MRPLSEFSRLSEAVASAKDRTFDEQRGLKETTATKVYRAILADWPDVEALEGPTQLCRLLEKALQGSRNDPESKLDRVKKICARMGILFKPAVKGQAD